jgi:hypothetical protein
LVVVDASVVPALAGFDPCIGDAMVVLLRIACGVLL